MNELKHNSKRTFAKNGFFIFLAGITLLGLCLYRIETVLPLWWDEGWTLQVARNWVEDGFYGRYIDGEPQPPGLAAHFPVVASAALSFKIFGVGVWQGRIPSVFYFILTSGILSYLVRNLYNDRTAISMFILLFVISPWKLNPIIRGREILGETTMIFWLLAGFLFFWKASGKSKWFLLPAMISWGVAINSKAQVLPFLVTSLIAALGFAMIKRWWNESLLIFSAGVGSWIISKWMLKIQGLILNDITAPSKEPLQNYYAFTALVLDWDVRKHALIIAATFGLLIILGIVVAIWKQFAKLKKNGLVKRDEIIRTALLALITSWLSWYILLSNAWFRYFYLPYFIGAIFAAAFLHEITKGFSLSAIIGDLKIKLRFWKPFFLFFIMLWVLFFFLFSTSELIYIFNYYRDENYLDVADYIQQHIDSDDLIETYETEMHFLLPEYRFHYPGDQVHVDVETQDLYKNANLINYNPLTSDPDYLILGPYHNLRHVYDQNVTQNSFNLIAEFPDYQIYERLR